MSRSRTKMSQATFVSPATRLFAKLAHATNLPSAEMTRPGGGRTASALPWTPPTPKLTRSVTCAPTGLARTPSATPTASLGIMEVHATVGRDQGRYTRGMLPLLLALFLIQDPQTPPATK